MACGKDLTEGEKVLVINEIAKVKINESIASSHLPCKLTRNHAPST